MSVRFVLCVLLSIPGAAMADASQGQFMGYQLDGQYPAGASTQQRVTTTGNLIVTAEQPVKPDNIAQVILLTTRKSMTIGYITASQWFATEPEARESGKRYVELLRAKYPDWELGWEVMDAQMRVTSVSLRQPPYELRLNISQDNQGGEQPWRFSMTLDWIDSSEPEKAWREKSTSELVALQQKERKQIVNEADARGL
jgi:hypothetical protein